MPGVIIVEALAQAGAVAVLVAAGKPRQARALRRHRRRALQADRRARATSSTLTCEIEAVRGPIGRGKARAHGRRRARRARHASRSRSSDDRHAPTAATSRSPASAATCPSACVTNDELSRARRHDRRVDRRAHRASASAASPRRDEALSDLALPACPRRARAGRRRRGRHRPVIVATVTPDMTFPATAAILADELGMPDAAAYDLLAGCTGFMYAIAQAYGDARRRPLAAARSSSAATSSRRSSTGTDRSTLVLFGDGAGAVVLERVDAGGFLGFELGADGGGGDAPLAAGQRLAALRRPRDSVRADERPRGVQVRDAGARVARRRRCSTSAARRSTTSTSTCRTRRTSGSSSTRYEKLGIPEEKVVVNVDRYGNTSSGSIPLALADARDDGRARRGRHRADDRAWAPASRGARR